MSRIDKITGLIEAAITRGKIKMTSEYHMAKLELMKEGKTSDEAEAMLNEMIIIAQLKEKEDREHKQRADAEEETKRKAIEKADLELDRIIRKEKRKEERKRFLASFGSSASITAPDVGCEDCSHYIEEDSEGNVLLADVITINDAKGRTAAKQFLIENGYSDEQAEKFMEDCL